jgi:hypothetical protein
MYITRGVCPSSCHPHVAHVAHAPPISPF